MASADYRPCLTFTFTELTGKHCRITYCNDQIAEIFGIQPEDIQGECSLPLSCVQPSDKARIERQLKALQQGHKNTVITTFCVDQGEDSLSFMVQAKTNTQSLPPCIEVSICMLNQAFVEQQKAVHSAQYFLNILDQLPDRFYYKDTQSCYLGGNKAWREHHGISNMDEWVGKSDFDCDLFDAETQKNVFVSEQSMMRTGTPIRNEETTYSVDGTPVYSESIKSPLYDAAGELIGLVGLTRDITAQVLTEQALVKAKLDAVAAVKAKSAFLAVMSHEIRTPMNGVIGCASLMTDTNLDDEQRQLLRTIQSCGEGLLVIINDILDYSKIEANQLVLDHHPFNLRELIEGTLDLFCKSAADKRIELNYYIAPEVPLEFIGDSSRIRQVLINFLGNAIKFTDLGEVTLYATNSEQAAENEGCRIQFEVQDTGIGIAEEHIAQLFEVFSQADASTTRKYGGTGLGLAISKQIIKALGGQVTVKSQLGKGSNFSFDIPLEQNQSLSQSGSHQGLETHLLAGHNVLVVDDNATNRKIIAASLRQWGMRSTCFSDPENALENLVHGHHYDIAILDQCMPKMQGSDLAQQLQQQEPELPVIILTSAADRIRGKELPFYCLQKPAHNSQLIRTLLRLLKLKSELTLHADSLVNNVIATGNQRSRILVVEDNGVNQMVICKILAKLGYERVTAVSDGAEAVEACANMEIDIILMDIQMRVMDGYDATLAIRTAHKDPHKPWIIALTAGVQKEDAERALECGMNNFTTKPIQIEKIKMLLDEAEREIGINGASDEKKIKKK